MMAKFYRNELDERLPHEFAEGGFSKVIDIYEDIINPKTGKLETKKTGEEPFYNKIQEAAEGITLENIIERYKIDLNDRHITQITEDIDMSEMPNDLIEAYSLINKLEKQFNGSTAEIKNHFGDFGGFLKSFKNGTLKQDLENIASDKFKKEAENKRAEAKAAKEAKEAAIAEAEAKVNELKGVNYGE